MKRIVALALVAALPIQFALAAKPNAAKTEQTVEKGKKAPATPQKGRSAEGARHGGRGGRG